jgi:GH15 family glucan-1,4-alpha-glucosidase
MPFALHGEFLDSRFRLSAGETRCLSLACTRSDIAVVPTLGIDAVHRVERTRQFWQDWAESCHAQGDYRDAILRGALVLKLLNFSLSGAVVAATYSKVMCWVALDRLLRLAGDGVLKIPAEQFRRERAAIESSVERYGFNAGRNSYVAEYGGDTPDASLLLAARYGYRDASHSRMRGTFDFVDATLARGDVVYRYPVESDGLPGAEGAFGIASFWAVEYLALAGRVKDARIRFNALLRRASDIGLYAEELDPDSGMALGNFPQALTHVGLITAGMAIRRTESGATDGGPHGLL